MPSVVVDSVVVTGGWDPSALERGLQASNQRLQQFVQQAANTRIGIQIEIGGSGGQAALEQIAASIGRLEATLTAAATPANSFFGDMVQGAQEALAEFAPLESRAATLARLLADLPSPQIDTQPAVSAIDTLIERQQLALRTATTLQGVLNQPIKAPPSLPTGVTLLGSQDVTRVRQIGEEAARAQRQLAGLKDVMLQQGQAARIAAGSNLAAAEALATFGRQQALVNGQVATSASTATRGLNLMRGAAVGLATQALGSTGAVGSLAAGLLFLAEIPNPVIIGIAGVIIAIQAIEGPARKAREETDKLIESLRQASRGRLPAFDQMALQINEVQKAAEAATQRIVALQVQSAVQGTGGGLIFGDQIKEEIERVKALQAELQKLIPLQQQLQAQAQSGAGTALIAQLGLQVATFGLAPEAARKYGLALQEGMTQAQRAAAGVLLDILAGLERQKKALEDAAKAREELLKGTNLPDVGEGLTKAVEALDAALAKPHKVGVFLDTGDVDSQLVGILAEIQKRQREVAAKAFGNIPLPKVDIDANFDRATASVEGVQDALLGAIAASNRFGAAAVKNANDARTAQEKLNDSIHDVTIGLDAIVGASRNVGLIGDEAANAIGSVLSLGDAIGSVIEKASAGNIAGLIGAGIGVLGSLFGKSATQQEHDRILQQNNERLRELSVSLSKTQGVGAAETAKQAAQALSVIPGIEVAGNPIDIIRAAGEARLQEGLARAGLSLEEFEQIIKQQTGLDVLDSKGHLVAETLADAVAGLQAIVDASTHFATGISDQQRQLETAARLGLSGFSPDTQVSRLEITRQIELENLTLDPELERRIQGLSLATEEGRQAFFEFQEMLFQMAKNGQLTAEQLGKFGSVDELLGPINDAADGVNAFKDATEAAAQRLGDLNIPAGFRRNALIFANASPGPAVAPITGPAVPVPPPSFHPVILPLPDNVQVVLDAIATKTPPDLLTATSAGAQRIVDALHGITSTLQATQVPPLETAATLGTTSGQAAQGPTVINLGPVTITQQPGESGEDLLDRLERRLERLGVLRTGNNQAFGPF
jgi:hypothetical protein